MERIISSAGVKVILGSQMSVFWGTGLPVANLDMKATFFSAAFGNVSSVARLELTAVIVLGVQSTKFLLQV